MGLEDIRTELVGRAREVKARLVQEFDELTDRDLDDAGDDPDRIVSTIQEKTGKPREEIETRVRQAAGR